MQLTTEEVATLHGILSDHDFTNIDGHENLTIVDRLRLRIRSLKRECASRKERIDNLNNLVTILRKQNSNLEWQLACALSKKGPTQ